MPAAMTPDTALALFLAGKILQRSPGETDEAVPECHT